MAEKRKTFIILALLLFLVGSPFILIKYHIFTLEKKVVEYLVVEKGYNQSEILSFKGEFGKLPYFSVIVIFADEPYIAYEYFDRDGIKQLSYIYY